MRAPRISIWRMLAGCAVAFCVVSLWIRVTFPGRVLAAIVGGIGSCISGSIDYVLVTLAFRYETIARIKKTRTYIIARFVDAKAWIGG